MKNYIIAIDWYVWTGKGTTAKWVAKALWYLYVDTGAMYRAVTLYAQRNKLLDADEASKIAMMKEISLSYVYNKETDHYDMILNGENVERAIRQTSLALELHKIVGIGWIRKILVERQQAYGKTDWLVVDGRDIGTVVFPHADLKIFLTCDLETRLERRCKQLQEQWLPVDRSSIRDEIILRDSTDYLSINAVNKKADDAVEVDTTHTTIDQQISIILDLIKKL